MKVYVVYQLGYTGNNELEILGVFKDIDEAKKCYSNNIQDNIKEFDFDYDKETPYTDELINGYCMVYCMVRLFKGGYQENWDNYLEIYLEEQEVK